MKINFIIQEEFKYTFFQVLNFIISDNNKGKIELFKNKKGKFKFEKIDSYEKLILPIYYTTLIKMLHNEKNMKNSINIYWKNHKITKLFLIYLIK